MSDLSGIQYEYLPLGRDFSRPRTIGPVSIERLKQFAEVASLAASQLENLPSYY
jgi:hypothetical protein